MEIIGERLILRDFKESDFSFFDELERNFLTYKYENNSLDANQIRANFLSALSESNSNPRERYHLALCLKLDMKPIGKVSIKLNWAEIREWEIGWALDPECWKKGYATEAVKIVIGYAINHLNAHRVVAYANADNYLSEKVMIRAGMKKDGILRETKYCNQKWCDELINSVLDKEWQ